MSANSLNRHIQNLRFELWTLKEKNPKTNIEWYYTINGANHQYWLEKDNSSPSGIMKTQLAAVVGNLSLRSSAEKYNANNFPHLRLLSRLFKAARQ